MNALLLVTALFTVSPHFASPNPTIPVVTIAPVEISVNINQGEILSGERAFKVSVSADDPVTKVEFYVGGDLRDNDTSTPYEFKLDTLAEPDGDLKIKFSAYTSQGTSGTKE